MFAGSVLAPNWGVGRTDYLGRAISKLFSSRSVRASYRLISGIGVHILRQNRAFSKRVGTCVVPASNLVKPSKNIDYLNRIVKKNYFIFKILRLYI